MILIFPFVVHSQDLNVEESIDSIFQNFSQSKRKFNGTALVSKNGVSIYDRSFGCSDCEGNIPNSPNTSFYIASISKSITSTAILQLKEEGELQLDQPLDTIFPDLPSEWTSTVTIRNLLNHTAGIPDYIRNGWVKDGMTNSQVFNKLKSYKYLEFRPGSKFKYSNSGYILLAYIIERLTGDSYEDYVAENIFIKCDMNNSWVHTISSSEKINSNSRAIGYNANVKKRDDYNLFTYGDGGIFSSTEDLYKFSKAILGDSLLSNGSILELSTPTTLNNGTEKSYGLGWFIGKNTNGTYVYHTGQLAGFRAYYEIQIDTDNTIVILNNTSINNLEELRNGIIKVLRY